ncbi:MAG: DNA methyltransferase [Actinomycetota bacterium]|nr:DNA methyltransferase [Actinomycetota bacterium]
MTTGRARYQLLPDLGPEEFASLKADIATNGVRVPVVVDAETGAVLDGHHRIQAVEELRAAGHKVPDFPREIVRLASDEARVELVLATNLFRRHLTRAQRAQLVADLREQGWSVRRIAEVLGAAKSTVADDLAGVQNRTPSDDRPPPSVVGKDRKTYPARRPPSLFVTNRRDAERARAALVVLPEGAQPTSLLRAEERAREAGYRAKREAADVAARLAGPDFELRVGDLREVWDDVPDGSIDAAVVDPPYAEEFVYLFEDLARLLARVSKPGRLVAIYCGHLHLDEEIRLLEQGGLSYCWHGVNVLPGRHTKVRIRMVNGKHRSVVLMSAGTYEPRKWLHDTFVAEGRGGPETRPLHPWQQALEPVVHWVKMVSEPGEVVFDPCCGSGTTAVAAVGSGRRFLGGDIEAGNVATTKERLEVELGAPGAGVDS